MLTPGTSTWADVLIPLLVALTVLVVPGLGVGLISGARVSTALGIAPAISTTFVVLAGSIAAIVGVAWGLLPLLVSLGALWAGCAVVPLARRLRPATGEQARKAVLPHAEQTPAPRGSAASPATASAVAQVAGMVVGVAVAATVVAWVYLESASSPELFPQHPDTIFHLGVTQWMAEHHDVSFQNGTDFNGTSPNTRYPIGFHSIAATVTLLTGQPAVIAVTATVLVAAGVLWPLCMGLLARHLFGPTPAVAAAGAATSVLFIGFPFMLMSFGVLWPNLFGQVLIPGCLATVVLLAKLIAPGVDTADSPRVAAFLLVLGLPGLAVAHPNALITTLAFSAFVLWIAALRRSWLDDGRGLRRWWPAGAATGAVVMGFLITGSIRLSPLFETGEPGPEMSVGESWIDILGFAPRTADPAPVLTLIVIIGIAVVVRRFPQAVWAIVALALMVTLYFINTAVDNDIARWWTWPWYNNAIRIAAVLVLPAALLAAAAFIGVGRLGAQAISRSWKGEAAVVGALVAVFLMSTQAFAPRDVTWVRPYFNPGESRSWASPEELRALHELAAFIPPDGLVVADPWKGGTYLYVVSGRRLFFQTEKVNDTPEKQLVGTALGDIASNDEVCRIAKDAGITHALVGGKPFLWGREISARDFSGIDAVQDSPGWELVAVSEPYSLYRLTVCTGV